MSLDQLLGASIVPSYSEPRIASPLGSSITPSILAPFQLSLFLADRYKVKWPHTTTASRFSPPPPLLFLFLRHLIILSRKPNSARVPPLSALTSGASGTIIHPVFFLTRNPLHLVQAFDRRLFFYCLAVRPGASPKCLITLHPSSCPFKNPFPFFSLLRLSFVMPP